MSSECKNCKDHFCCIYLGQRTCPQHCGRQNCFCGRCQLYQAEVISPAVFCRHCDFLYECYSYKYIGRIAKKNSDILEASCRDHCATIGCPHRDETTVDLSRQTLIDYSHLIQHVNPQEKIDVLEQSIVTSQLKDRETLVPGPSGNSSMGLRLPATITRSSARILGSTKSCGTRRGGRRPTRSGNGRSELRLSSKSVVGTRSASVACYSGMQRRKRNH